MTTTDEQEKAAALYTALMEEVKIRFNCIRNMMDGQTGLAPPLIREFCFLQFRMIGELIALGCLVAHEDIEATQSRQIRTLWSASEIMERLEQLHPDFFPVPFLAKVTGPESSHLSKGPGLALTKQGLLKLYGKAGGVLHRGTRAKLLTPKFPAQTDFPDIKEWADGLRLLLHNHLVLRLGGQAVFLCEMGGGPNGAVSVKIGVASGPSKRFP